MAFDAKRFVKEKMVPREEGVAVPDLGGWFGEGEAPVWRVRGLTGHELGKVREVPQRNKNMAAILDALVAGGAKEKAEGMKELIGLADETPEDTAIRMEMLRLGSVEPKVDQELAVRLCRTFPIEFYTITNKIQELTGMGHVPGKVKPSGETQESAPPSPCVPPEGDSSTK